jgi:hypothetical protein
LGSLCLPGIAHGAALDKEGDINLGVRAYTAARIGTQDTDVKICNLVGGKTVCGGSNGAAPPPARIVKKSLTFPVSPAGHMRQQRSYVEAELDHNLSRLLQEGFGPFTLLNELPFTFKKFKYHLTYRGEYEGVYDYGPAEYRTAYQYRNKILVPDFSGNQAPIGRDRRRLRQVAVLRNRLFQAYAEMQVSKVMMRIGRQILSWGQTDAFRLLDNINPIDNSFGGFLVPLDERRVPLDMLLANYRIGSIGPFYEAFLEAYAAIDENVGYEPGIPVGSPWALPNLGDPSATTQAQRTHPQRVVKDTRGGFNLKFTAPMPLVDEMEFSLVNYWTYLDTPAVQSFVSREFPRAISSGPAQGFLANTIQTAPRVMISGMASTFGFPVDWARALYLSGQPIIRYELAYFHGEPRSTQQQLDPFIYAVGGCSRGRIITNPDGSTLCTGGKRYGDSWNFVLGADTNQFIRWINPNQSLFITTQFFFKHLISAAARNRVGLDRQAPQVFNGEVLPVPALDIEPPFLTSGASQSVLVHNPVNQYLQTLLISTSYYSGQISPTLTLVYDWGGAWVAQPAVTFSRDPFRFTFSYSYLSADHLFGGSGVSLLRDRDNVLFQIDYVI